MVQVTSSWVKEVAFVKGNVQVHTKAGDKYIYLDVPQAAFNRLVAAKSKGQYVCDNMKGKYRCIKLAAS